MLPGPFVIPLPGPPVGSQTESPVRVALEESSAANTMKRLLCWPYSIVHVAELLPTVALFH